MPDSIKELIVKNADTTLQGITAANGYANTILSVQRPLPQGNTYTAMPMLGVMQEDDERVGISEPFITKKFILAVVVMTVIDTAVYPTLSVDEALNSLAADVEKALTRPGSPRRGGYAEDTVFIDTAEYVPQEGMPDIGVALRFEITYRHRIGDPYSA